jgi:DNA-binding CsgD family transcriptional regulator
VPALPTDALDRARQACARREWDRAWLAFADADRESPLPVDDLELMAAAAVCSGRDAEMVSALERVYAATLATDPERAARAAHRMGARLNAIGETARSSGWMARAARLVEGRDCVEHGWLALSQVYRGLRGGDLPAAIAAAEHARGVAERFGDADLAAFARGLQGRALTRLGEVERAMALMDEAMTAVATGEVSTTISGLVYCTVIASCQAVYAVERAREWTVALTAWCEAQPELVPFSGACLVHRAEILRFGGSWPGAFAEANRAAERMAHTGDVLLLADAHYERAEIHRLRGERAAAEQGYRAVSDLGGEPHPGLALLRLAEGRVDVAASALRRVLDGTADRLGRARHLPALVEVLLAAGDLDGAADAAKELADLALVFGTSLLGALAERATGAVALARGEGTALSALSGALLAWQRLDSPYEAARTRLLLARACEQHGDAEGAALHRDAARRVFQELGARPDLEVATPPSESSGLTPRELEVLLRVASGKTNKAIARELFVSGKTVDRHVSNLFAKLGVSSRAAATAWAYENGVVARG